MEDVDAFLVNVPAAERAELERIRKIVRQLVPDTEESISYMMPAFKYKKKPLLYYAAFKDHMSIFPTSGPVEAADEKLARRVTGKGTIQFTLDDPLSDEEIRGIVLARKDQIDS